MLNTNEQRNSFLEEAYTKKYKVWIRFAENTLGNYDNNAAQDCVQAAFVKALTMSFPIERYVHACCVMAKIIRWEVANHYKREWYYKKKKTSFAESCFEEKFVENPEDYSLDYYPFGGKVLDYIKKLTKRQREAIEIHMNGLTFRAGSKLYGCDEANIRQNYLAAIKSLKEMVFTEDFEKLKNGYLQKKDDLTDKIMDMHSQNIKNSVIAKFFNIPEHRVRHRIRDRKKSMEKNPQLYKRYKWLPDTTIAQKSN